MMQAPATSPTYLRPAAAAERLGLSVRTIYNWIYTGRIKGRKAGKGGPVWVREDELLGLLK